MNAGTTPSWVHTCGCLPLLGLVLFCALAAQAQSTNDYTASGYLKGMSAGSIANVKTVQAALGRSNKTEPALKSNPNPPNNSPSISKTSIVANSERWHNISHPSNALCKVAVKPYLLYTNSHDLSPSLQTKQPTASHPPTSILGSIDLQISATGTAIQAPYTVTVGSDHYSKIINAYNAQAAGISSSGAAVLQVTSSNMDLEANSGNVVNVTFTVDASSTILAPKYVAVNDQECILNLNITLKNLTPDTTSQQAQTEASTVPLSIVNGTIYGTDGKATTLKGVNWFGFETAATMVAGLWQGPTALSQDFGVVLYRIQLLGFNVIRLPFSFQILYNTAPVQYTTKCTPVTSVQIGQSVTPAGTNIPTTTVPPVQASSTGGNTGNCNAQVPNTSNFQRYLWVIQQIVDNGFYVLIDNHLAEDLTAVNNPTLWIEYYLELINGISVLGQKYLDSVMVDILNEPDAAGLTWVTAGALYIEAMNAINAKFPNTIFFIEGCGQLGFAMCWGDGFVTDDHVIAKFGLTDPKPILNQIQAAPYRNQVVISPHYYPPSISGQTVNTTGAGLFYKMQTSFGYFTGAGYNGQKFPVVIGETGSFYTAAKDIAMLADMSNYMNNDYSTLGASYGPSSFPHANLESLFWWCWNANSGDTGGIVENDWVTVIWSKINWIVGAINLIPWYLTVEEQNTVGPITTPTTVTTAPPTTTSAPTAPLITTMPKLTTTTPTTTTANPGPSTTLTPALSSAAPRTPPPTTTKTSSLPPQTASVQTPPPTPPPNTMSASSGSQSCTITYTLSTDWPTQTSAPYGNTINLSLTNNGSGAISVPYTLCITNPSYAVVSGSAWNWGASGLANGGTICGPVTQTWENVYPASTISGLGANVFSTTNSFAPTSGSINGIACAIAS